MHGGRRDQRGWSRQVGMDAQQRLTTVFTPTPDREPLAIEAVAGVALGAAVDDDR